jgi:hypothetical protein
VISAIRALRDLRPRITSERLGDSSLDVSSASFKGPAHPGAFFYSRRQLLANAAIAASRVNTARGGGFTETDALARSY